MGWKVNNEKTPGRAELLHNIEIKMISVTSVSKVLYHMARKFIQNQRGP